MKSPTDLAEEFVEGLARGIIEARMAELRKLYNNKSWNNVTSQVVEFQTRIVEYLSETDSEKKNLLALLVLNRIMIFRTIGLYINNTTVQQLELARERVNQLEKEVAEKDEKIGELLATLGMKPPEDRKVGVR